MMKMEFLITQAIILNAFPFVRIKHNWYHIISKFIDLPDNLLYILLWGAFTDVQHPICNTDCTRQQNLRTLTLLEINR
jgi:hypothetical protein